MHDSPHPLAGCTVKLAVTESKVDGDPFAAELTGTTYTVEDWWDRLTGQSWLTSEGNPAAVKYAVRSGLAGIPVDDDVVYGKADGLGHLVHVSELGEVVS